MLFRRIAVLGLMGLCVAACDAREPEDHQTESRLATLGAPAFEGRFVMRIADFEDGTSETFFVLKREGEAVKVALTEGVHVDRGALVQAWGEYDDQNVLQIEHVEVIEAAPEPRPRAIGKEPRPARKVAMVLLQFEGEGPVPLSPQEADSRVFTGNTSTNNFYQEVSYGVEKITGQVFGPYTIEKPSGCGDLNDPLGTEKLSLEGRRAVKEEYPLAESEFDQFMYYFPKWNACSWAGLAEVGTPDNPQRDTWYNQASGCVVLAQELGHNYGMRHSHSYQCQGGPYSDDCEFSEYGHPFDPMGGGCGHINQTQKAYMDWTEGCNQVTATADGTFNLVPTELPCNGIQNLRFATGNTTEDGDPLYYYLEYRQPLGLFDSPNPGWSGGLSGVVVHVGTDRNANSVMADEEEIIYGPTTYILDMPGSGRMMHEGDSYDDHDGVVSFSVTEESADRAVIQVTFPGGGSGQPTCMDDTNPMMDMGNFGSMECASEPLPPDLTAPTVEITYPNDGDEFEPGATFDVVADAQDERGIAWVRLYLDGEPVYKDFAPPWEFPIENIPEGTYEFGVVASDGPNWTPSEAVTVTVKENPNSDDDGGEEDDDGGTDGGEDDDGGTEDGGDEEAGADGEASEGGCGCSQTDPRGGAGLALFGLALGVSWRRRRSA